MCMILACVPSEPQCHVEEPDRAEGVVRLGRAASLVLLTERDREAGMQDLMVALAAAARSVADSVSDRGFLSLPRVSLDTWLCARASGHTCRRVCSAQSSGMSEVAIYRA